jgi:hypothetical protein
MGRYNLSQCLVSSVSKFSQILPQERSFLSVPDNAYNLPRKTVFRVLIFLYRMP